jgi:hypothetical protein
MESFREIDLWHGTFLLMFNGVGFFGQTSLSNIKNESERRCRE